MKALTSSRPRRGACNEYRSSMSGAARLSTTLRFHGLPQNSLNQRPTMALFSCSLDLMRKGDALRQVYASGVEMGGVLRRRTWSKEKLATASALTTSPP